MRVFFQPEFFPEEMFSEIGYEKRLDGSDEWYGGKNAELTVIARSDIENRLINLLEDPSNRSG